MSYEPKRCWSVLLRLCHWSFVGSITVLVVTGLYIHYPWTNTLLFEKAAFPVADMRYYHFFAGWIFSTALLVRFFLLFFGSKQERFWDFLPITPRNLKNFVDEIFVYLYIKEGADHPDHRLGHNAVAGTVFFVLFILGLLQVLSGFFILYPESAFWQQWGGMVFEAQQSARYVHHLIMWGFLLFVVVHIYMVVWNDLKNRDGLISSIVTGVKFRPKKV